MYQAARIAKTQLAKHSEFRVGVYLITDKLDISSGNVSHTNSRLTMCAEMLALANAKSNGATPLHMYMVSDSDKPVFPCAICRQYASEFPKLKVTTYSSDGKQKITKTVAQLYPNPFER